jgi:polysaccharide pyruvyl transferase WcaK-like protein
MRIHVIRSGGPHKGAVSITTSVLSIVKAAFPDARLTLETIFPEDDRQSGVDVVESLIPRSPTVLAKLETLFSILKCTVWILMYRYLGVEASSLFNENQLRCLSSYSESNLVVTCTADVLSSTYGILPPLGFLYPILMGTLLKKPTAILAAQIGPFKGISGRIVALLTRCVLNRVTLITVRDKSSEKNLRDIGVTRSRVYLTADLAFLLQPASNERVNRIMSDEGVDQDARPLIGVNVSALIYRYGFPSLGMQEKKEEYIKIMSKTVDQLIEEFKATILFVPHVFGPSGNDDRIMAHMVYRNVGNRGNCRMILNEYSPEELKGIIARLDMFISGRMHALIHAISAGVPSVGIDYTFKAKELMDSIGQKNQICDIDHLNYDELIERVQFTYRNRERIHGELAIGAELLKKRSLLNAKLLQAYFREVEHAHK